MTHYYEDLTVGLAESTSRTVTERDSFDAWGRRRNINGTDNTACAITSATDVGYTGHEQMDTVCQVNATARLYDPTIGRFLSPDSVISDTTDGQALNRYSYVSNRPLSATDPTGHDPDLRSCHSCDDCPASRSPSSTRSSAPVRWRRLPPRGTDGSSAPRGPDPGLLRVGGVVHLGRVLVPFRPA